MPVIDLLPLWHLVRGLSSVDCSGVVPGASEILSAWDKRAKAQGAPRARHAPVSLLLFLLGAHFLLVWGTRSVLRAWRRQASSTVDQLTPQGLVHAWLSQVQGQSGQSERKPCRWWTELGLDAVADMSVSDSSCPASGPTQGN